MVITLCGSARFEKLFHEWNKSLSLSGHVVFSLAAFPSIEGEKMWYTEEQKDSLDMIHKAKISHSDAIVVLNKFAYIGPSTLSEIRWASMLEKEIYFLESWGQGYGIGSNHSQEIRDEVMNTFKDIYPRSPINTSNFPRAHMLTKTLITNINEKDFI